MVMSVACSSVISGDTKIHFSHLCSNSREKSIQRHNEITIFFGNTKLMTSEKVSFPNHKIYQLIDSYENMQLLMCCEHN